MFNRRASLRLSTIAILLDLHNYGDVHPMLFGSDQKWYPKSARGRLKDEAMADAAAAGLVDRRGQLDSYFLDVLPLLSGGDVEYTAGIWRGENLSTVLASANRMEAIIAVSDGERAEIVGLRNERLAEALVRQLPECRPGGGGTFNVPLAEVLGETSPYGGGGYTSSNIFDGASSDYNIYKELISLPRHGYAELYVATRHEGRRNRLEPPIRVYDTIKGRWFVQQINERGREPWLVGAPATIADLVQRLYKELNTLTVIRHR